VPQADPLVLPLPRGFDAWSTFQRLAHLPYALFLDSAAVDPELGRYSYIAGDPIRVEIAHDVADIPLLLLRLRRQYQQWRRPHDSNLPPFQGGLAGLWGYGLHRALERIPAPQWQDFDIPHLALGWYDWVIAFDHLQDQATLISTGLTGTSIDQQRSFAKSRAEGVMKSPRGEGPGVKGHLWSLRVLPPPPWRGRVGEGGPGRARLLPSRIRG
jgi:para-aminobenzoate synthetase component I